MVQMFIVTLYPDKAYTQETGENELNHFLANNVEKVVATSQSAGKSGAVNVTVFYEPKVAQGG